MGGIDFASAGLSAGTVGAALLVACQLFLRRPPSPAYRAAGAFFLVFAAIALGNWLMVADPSLAPAATLAQGPLMPLLAPLLWFYVADLTADVPRRWRPTDLWHLLPALAQGLVPAWFLLLPPADQRGMFDGSGPATTAGQWFARGFVVLLLLWLVQTSVYTVAILRRLHQLRPRLRQVFASTESRELRWLTAITVVTLPNWLLTVAYNLGLLGGARIDLLLAAGALVFVAVMGVWVVRQAPAFQIAADAESRLALPSDEASPIDPLQLPDDAGPRYERSQLDAARLEQIARRIEAAFRVDRLHANPGLSLSDLSSRIGVRANYISQTLTRALGTSFFEYVNRFRVEDAKRLLRNGEASITTISYEAGFNSRSAFYSAFKAETGITPSAFRARPPLDGDGPAPS